MVKKNKYEVALITDGNASIGMGHIMRCSAIADALNDLGLDVLFIVSDKDSEEIVNSLGYNTERLECDYRDLSNEAELIKEILVKYKTGFAFFDSYYVGNELFEAVSLTCPVGCFGYGKKYYKGMSLIVPYGISSNKKWYEETFELQRTTVLFGSKYIPLKKCFWCSQADSKIYEPSRLLLTCGGADPLGITEALVSEIRDTGIGIQIDVVVGKFFDDEKLKAGCKKHSNVVFHEGLNDLSSLMHSRTVAISSGGTTIYELMASCVPTIAYAIADNQLGNEKLDGALVWCGDVRENGILNHLAVKRIVSTLDMLIKDPQKRKALIENGRKICDGHGAERIAYEIRRLSLQNL